MDAPDPEQLFEACATTLLSGGEPLLLAVSGGSDSMALLAAAVRWDRARVAVAHVHHGQRPSADADARLVEEQCGSLGVPCEVVHAPPDPTAAATRSETAARARRMTALAMVAQRRGIDWIAAAHHRDDAHETLLLHLRRGHRGDRALASIPTVRSLEAGARLLHPFLYGGALAGGQAPGRRELAAYRERSGVPFREDPTNRDLSIPRNAIRSLLDDAASPLDADTLERHRRTARGRLERRLGQLSARLQDCWRAEGRGCVVDHEAWVPPAGDSEEAWVPELLRLLGAGLSRARRVAPRASVVREVGRLAQRRSGTLRVPADPAPLELRASQQGIHLPAEGLPPGTSAARILTALSRTSLYV